MTNKQTKALLKAIEIIIDISDTKEKAIEKIREISNELEKEPIDHSKENQ